MTLAEVSIRRHVFAVMINAVIILFGILGLRDVGVDRTPNIDLPVITVTVEMSGADPRIMDNAVTEVIERRVNRVPGIDTIRSMSSPGISVINVTFDLDRDVDVAFNEVQSKVNEVLADLPEDADPPINAKTSIESRPILWLALSGDRGLADLSLYALNVVRQQIENVAGVGEVQFGGGQGRSIRIELDPARLAAQNVTVGDVTDAIGREHVQLSGGFLISGNSENLLKLDLEYHDLTALENLVVLERGGATISLGDVAEIVDGLADQRRVARFNGEQAVALGIVKVPGSNTLAIIDEVKERLRGDILPQLPPGLNLDIAYDESIFILEQVDALYMTILVGIFFAALVIWVFLKSLRAMLIVSLSIPVSLMAAVAVIYFFGYTLNSVTMLALLLLIGIVVDDAIVVLENIYRHRATDGARDSVKAAIGGSNEVFFAVVASSLALISIFASVVFLDAIVGRFFESFAVVVTFGVLASSIVALTLIPMLGSRFLGTGQEQPGRVSRAMERGLAAVDRDYERLLGRGLRARWSVLILTGGVMALALFIARDVEAEFAPEQDTGQFVINVQTPLGASLAYTQQRLRRIEAVLKDTPQIDTYFASVGAGDADQVNRASIFIGLADRDERAASQQQIIADLQPRLAVIPGVRTFPSTAGLTGGTRGEPLQFAVTGPELDQLGALAEQVRARLARIGDMGRIDLDLSLDLPQLALRIDRERAASLGIPADDAARTANVLIGGQNVARYNDHDDGRRYNLRVKAREDAFTSEEDLSRIYLRNEDDEMVRIDTIAHFERTVGPASIARYGTNYAANFYVDPDMPLDAAVAEVEAVADDMMPLGYSVAFMGEAQELDRTVSAIAFVLVLAVTLVYMVLASQFNSFVQPVFIMVAQPLALVGGLFALYLGGYTLNIFSMIGLVLLMGLVTKNGILLVDLTNQYRARGMAVDEALRAACPVRLRPILMTSLTLILAMLPALFGVGAGAEANAPMAAAIIGGMIAAMLLTLLAIPAAYSLLESAREGRSRPAPTA